MDGGDFFHKRGRGKREETHGVVEAKVIERKAAIIPQSLRIVGVSLAPKPDVQFFLPPALPARKSAFFRLSPIRPWPTERKQKKENIATGRTIKKVHSPTDFPQNELTFLSGCFPLSSLLFTHRPVPPSSPLFLPPYLELGEATAGTRLLNPLRQIVLLYIQLGERS